MFDFKIGCGYKVSGKKNGGYSAGGAATSLRGGTGYYDAKVYNTNVFFL
jgi:hypothetical protein